MNWQIMKALAEADIQLNGVYENKNIQPVKLTEDAWHKIAAVVDAAKIFIEKYGAFDDEPEQLAIQEALENLEK